MCVYVLTGMISASTDQDNLSINVINKDEASEADVFYTHQQYFITNAKIIILVHALDVEYKDSSWACVMSVVLHLIAIFSYCFYSPLGSSNMHGLWINHQKSLTLRTSPSTKHQDPRRPSVPLLHQLSRTNRICRSLCQADASIMWLRLLYYLLIISDWDYGL